MRTIVFWLIFALPGHEPIQFENPVENLAACLFEVHEVFVRPSHKLLIEGGLLQAGCAVKFAPSVEH